MSKLRAKKPEEVSPGHCKILIWGNAGVGKTWFSLNFPNVYYWDVEGGARLAHYQKRLKDAGGVYVGPDDGSCDFPALLDEVKALSTEKHGYKTLVIDSISKIYAATLSMEQERLGSKDQYGASKKLPVNYMRRLMAWIGKLDMNVVLIAHSKIDWASAADSDKKSMTFDAWEKLDFELDLALNFQQHSPQWRSATVTKTRLLGFPFLEKFDISNKDGDVGYKEFTQRYGKDYIEKAAIPVVLATGDQIAEFEKLLSVLKIEDGAVEKMLTKAGAETLNELTQSQMETALTWLKGKLK